MGCDCHGGKGSQLKKCGCDGACDEESPLETPQDLPVPWDELRRAVGPVEAGRGAAVTWGRFIADSHSGLSEFWRQATISDTYRRAIGDELPSPVVALASGLPPGVDVGGYRVVEAPNGTAFNLEREGNGIEIPVPEGMGGGRGFPSLGMWRRDANPWWEPPVLNRGWNPLQWEQPHLGQSFPPQSQVHDDEVPLVQCELRNKDPFRHLDPEAWQLNKCRNNACAGTCEYDPHRDDCFCMNYSGIPSFRELFIFPVAKGMCGSYPGKGHTVSASRTDDPNSTEFKTVLAAAMAQACSIATVFCVGGADRECDTHSRKKACIFDDEGSDCGYAVTVGRAGDSRREFERAVAWPNAIAEAIKQDQESALGDARAGTSPVMRFTREEQKAARSQSNAFKKALVDVEVLGGPKEVFLVFVDATKWCPGSCW